jgi:hypothetical protein
MEIMNEQQLSDKFIKDEAKKILIKKVKGILLPILLWVGLALLAGVLTFLALG